jgi:hypothetical protein
MQAEICEDHPVSDQDEEANTATEVSVCWVFYFTSGSAKRMTFLQSHSFVSSPYVSDDLQKSILYLVPSFMNTKYCFQVNNYK